MKAVGLAMSKVDVRTTMPSWLRPFNYGAGRGLGQVGYVGFALAACLALGLAFSPAASAQAPGPPAPNPDNRAYELVSPPDKGATGLGFWYNGPRATVAAGIAAYEGERFAAQATLGGTLLDEAPFSFANDWALAERLGDRLGWRSHSANRNAMTRAQMYRFIRPTRGAAEDLSLIGWSSNAGLLAPFEEMRDWHSGIIDNPAFLGDWRGSWEIVAPTDLGQIDHPGDADPGNDAGFVAGMAVAAAGGQAVVSFGARGLAGRGCTREADVWVELGTGAPCPDPSVDMVERAGGTSNGARSTYLIDATAGLSNSFPGEGVRSLVHVCTAGTALLARVESGGEFLLAERPCPDPEPGREAALTSPYGATVQAAPNGNAARNTTERIVSRDGSRVFFMSPDPANPRGSLPTPPNTGCTGTGEDSLCPAQLFVHQRNADGSKTTRWLSRPEPGLLGAQAASLAGQAIFEGASVDGSRVFFRSNSPLTADDPNAGCGAPCLTGSPSNQSWDLYMAELAPGSDPTGPGFSLSRISGGPSGDADCNSPQGGAGAGVGALRFVSADGRRAYFTCAAPLGDPEAPHNQGPAGGITEPDGPVTAATNLYMYSDADGVAQWQFVARLPRSTSSSNPALCATTSVMRRAPLNPDEAGNSFSDASRCVQGTSDGAFLTFWTGGQLTADDPDATSMDIYGYDLDAHELVRITRAQGGEGSPYPCGIEGSAATTDCYGDTGYQSFHALPLLGVATDPEVAGDRIAFFQSQSRLVPAHTDESMQTYMWKNGALSLLTPGSSPTDGYFYKGNDRSGTNVFFVTRDRLTWQDHDALLDAYTARIDGGIPEPLSPALCEVLNDGCLDAGKKAPDADDPSSAAFSGEGNFTPGRALNPRRCIRLARVARFNLQRAERFKRLAQQSARRGATRRARVLNRRAKSSARSARRAIVQTKRCRAAVRKANADRRVSR